MVYLKPGLIVDEPIVLIECEWLQWIYSYGICIHIDRRHIQLPQSKCGMEKLFEPTNDGGKVKMKLYTRRFWRRNNPFIIVFICYRLVGCALSLSRSVVFNAISVQSFQLIRFDTHCWCDFERLIEQMAHLLIHLLLLLPHAPLHHHSWNLRIGYCNAVFIHLWFTWFYVIDVLLQSVRWKSTIDCTKYTKSDRFFEQSEIVIDQVYRCTHISVCLSAVCLYVCLSFCLHYLFSLYM